MTCIAASLRAWPAPAPRAVVDGAECTRPATTRFPRCGTILMVTAWIVRAGQAGERDDWALHGGQAGGGFSAVPDLTGINDRQHLKALVSAAYRGSKPGKISNFVGQLWALTNVIKPGDIIVLPLKTTKQIAIGVCTSGYQYRANEPTDRRHTIGVDWKRDDVPRLALKDDLLNTINGAMTIFQAANNNAAARLQKVLDAGTDPGASDLSGSAAKPTPHGSTTTADSGDADPVDPSPAITLEAIRDRLRTHLVENFGQHKLTALVAEILRARGYVCEVSPPGPDGGVDIIAGSGPLGLDSPTVVIEVKSEQGQIGIGVFNGLSGAVKINQADQGLLVAWGGLAKPAEQARLNQRTVLRVWDAEDVTDQLLSVYDRLPDEVRAAIPLKRAWVLVDETG